MSDNATTKGPTNGALSYVGTANLKFRSITTMLRAFQPVSKHGMGLPIVDPCAETKSLEAQSRILSALATLFVRDTEVVAVASVAKDHSTEAGLVAVERTVGTKVEGDTVTSSGGVAAAGARNGPRGFSLNGHRAESQAGPPLGYANPPRHFKSANASVEYQWHEYTNVLKMPTIELPGVLKMVHKGRKDNWGRVEKPTLHQHASTVLRVLYGSIKRNSFSEWVYVIGVSYPKMHCRMQHPFSTNILELLASLDLAPPEHAQPSDDDGRTLSRRDLKFLRSLAQLQNITKVPNLPTLTLDLKTITDDSRPLYSPAAAGEFHTLLLFLLKGYKTSLDALFSFERSPQLQSSVNKMYHLIRAVYYWGIALYDIIYSPAMAEHLATAKFPPVNYPQAGSSKTLEGGSAFSAKARKALTPSKSKPTGRPIDPPDLSEEENSEFLTLMKEGNLCGNNAIAYQNWLRLMVGYFHSVSTITSFLRKQQNYGLDLHVVSLPPQDTKMLTWPDLLRAFPDSPSEADVKRASERLDGRGSSLFRPGGSLLTGKYTGAAHCEAGIATLLYLSSAQTERFKGQSDLLAAFKAMEPVVGVSKRCCMVCEALLSKLEERGYIGKLHRPPSHSPVYGCSLPEGLPHDIVDGMLQIFQDMLKQCLIKAIAIADASDRERRSIESLDSDGATSDSSSNSGDKDTKWLSDALVILSDADDTETLTCGMDGFIAHELFTNEFGLESLFSADGL